MPEEDPPYTFFMLGTPINSMGFIFIFMLGTPINSMGFRSGQFSPAQMKAINAINECYV